LNIELFSTRTYSIINLKNITCNGVNQIDNNVCSGNGNCLDNKCQCFFGYFGNNCEITSCNNIDSNKQNVCSGNGICSKLNTCQCFKKFTGDFCESYHCYDVLYNNTNVVCSGKGNCTFPDNCKCNNNLIVGLNCESCANGYYGNNCNSPICNGIQQDNSTVCSGRGNCTSPNNCKCNNNLIVGLNCESCANGYYGNNCSFPICNGVQQNNSTVCSGRGSCILPNNCKCNNNLIVGLNCESCANGYYGANCNFPICNGIQQDNSTVCSGRGSCTSPNNCKCNNNLIVGLNCESCANGYYGDNCSFPICNGVQHDNSTVCSGRGNCTSPNNCKCNNNLIVGLNCESCANGYHGDNCNFPICNEIQHDNSTVCHGRGNCTSPNNCKCDENIIGFNCESCANGYYGENCKFPICNKFRQEDPAVCSGRGVCVSPDVCECNNAFIDGLNCESCVNGYYGENCNLLICAGILSNDSRVCSGRGNCSSPNRCKSIN
jgi:hypothetical protein